METINDETNFQELLNQYNLTKASLGANPNGNHDNGFNKKAHNYAETWRGKTDLILIHLLLIKANEITFATVEKHDDIYHVIYNPFSDELNGLEDMTYDLVEAERFKPKSLKIYQAATNKRIRWFVKIMTGDLDSFFTFKLAKWFQEPDYKSNMKGFCGHVTALLRYYPHKDCNKIAVYLKKFLEWMISVEDDQISIHNVIEKVLVNLEFIFFPKDREDFKLSGTLEQEIKNSTCKLGWQDCSKNCNDKFSKLDFNIGKDIDFIDQFRKKNRGNEDGQIIKIW